MVLLSGILWGCIGVLIKKLNAGGLGAMQISMVRMVFAALLFTGTLALVAPGKLRVRVRDLWMFVGTGIVSVVLFNVCYFYTMIKSQASIAVVLLYTSPVFVMLLSALMPAVRKMPVCFNIRRRIQVFKRMRFPLYLAFQRAALDSVD